jgi:hypothetical protein
MKKKLGEILIEMGAVMPGDLNAALEAQSAGDPSRLGDILVSSGKVMPGDMARALAQQFDMPFVQLEQVSPDVAALVPIEVQLERQLVPFKDDGPGKGVHVAVADPSTKDVLAELEFQIGRPLVVSIAAADEIASVHAALQGDVVAAVIAEEEPAPPPPAPVPSPGKPQAVGRVALKRVAVPIGAAGVEATAALPVFGADLPPLELKAAPRPRPSAPMPPPAASPAPKIPAVASAELPARAKRPTVRTEPFAAPPVLKPAGIPEPTPSPRKPKTGSGMKKVTPPSTDDWAVKDAGQALPEPTAQLSKLEPRPPLDKEPEATALVAKLEPVTASRPAVKTQAQFAPDETVTAEKVTAEKARVSTPVARTPVKTGQLFPENAAPEKAITAPSRGAVKTDVDWSKPPATAPSAVPADVPLADLPAWMREGALEAGGDALSAAVEKAVLVAGAPRTVARLLRLLVERGLLTEREILDELEKQ